MAGRVSAVVTAWHPYADAPYRDTLTCVTCGAVKPPRVSPKGWEKRVATGVVGGHPQARTLARCPACVGGA